MSNTLKKQLALDAIERISDPRRWTSHRPSIGFGRWRRDCAVEALFKAGKAIGLSKPDVHKLFNTAKIISINDTAGREAVIAHLHEIAQAQ